MNLRRRVIGWASRSLSKLRANRSRVDTLGIGGASSITRQDVCNCYRLILGREPEDESVIAEALVNNKSFYELRVGFLRSPEFRELYKTLLTETEEDHPFRHRLRRTVAFIHLLKTGGTTLHSMLEKNFPRETVWPHHHNSLHRYSVAELGQYDLFSGHYDYHSIGYIPRSHVNTVSIFREPVDRLISFYRFVKSHPPGREFEHNVFVHLAHRLTVEEFFEHPDIRTRPEIYNHYFLVFGFAYAQAKAQWPPSGTDVIAEALDRAFTNVRALTAIGITEKFEESTHLIFRSLHLPAPALVKKLQVTDALADSDQRYSRVPKVNMTHRLREALRELASYDYKIYHLAVAEFNQRSSLVHSSSQRETLPHLNDTELTALGGPLMN